MTDQTIETRLRAFMASTTLSDPTEVAEAFVRTAFPRSAAAAEQEGALFALVEPLVGWL